MTKISEQEVQPQRAVVKKPMLTQTTIRISREEKAELNAEVAAKKPNKKNRVKRSSSETFVREQSFSSENKTIDQTSSSSTSVLFKSKSTRNLQDESTVIKEVIRNRNPIRLYSKIPKQSMPPLHITNQDVVKKNFLEAKIAPVLQFKADDRYVQSILTKHNKPSYDHFFKAKNILDLIKSRYPNGPFAYYEAMFGKKIASKECMSLIGDYLTQNKIAGEISINFAPGLTCSGRIVSYNPNKSNPETRKFIVWINDGHENQFLRKKGIICLCDHEIGTHYYRAYNDGLQIWFNDRKKFGLRSLSSTELLKTEEGLAALHTLMNANLKYLYLPALLYYIACMADRMTFEQLYNHMETYIEMPDERWKLVTRVKRGISDPHSVGCYSRDQSYFEGAIDILNNLDNIDFALLMSGKLCLDELDRVRRISRVNCLKLPKFFKNLNEYKSRLREIGIINGIIDPKSPILPPLVEQIVEEEPSVDEKTAKKPPSKKNKFETKRQANKNQLETYLTLINGKKIDDLYEYNKLHQNLTINDVKTFISRFIVAHTKAHTNNTITTPRQIADSNSALCVLL